MSWKQHLTDQLAQALRFTLKACIFADLFILSLFGVWFSAKFVWHLFRFMDRTLFGSPW